MIALGALLMAVNAALLVVANNDRSWGAIGVAMFLGPLANAAVGLIALVGTTVVAAVAGSKVPFGTIVLGSIFLPVAAIVLDWVVIATMPLHGC